MATQTPELNAAIQASGESTLEGATKKAQEQVDQLFNVSLKIAVTGETGTGKSTFVNAIRGLKVKDEGAAKIGFTETTTEPTPYKHPTMPNVVLWDLPGIGSPNFKAKTYLKQVEFDKYDFFIIISSERFKENDLMLAKEIQKRKKLFYFVRSKIDNDIEDEQETNFNKEETLSIIRRNCEENLKEIKNPKVFLISSKKLYAFDFEKLVDTLKSELPEHKRKALLQSLPVSSLAILEEKVEMFEKAVWAAAFVSGGIAAVPVPGLLVACDAAMLVAFFTRCYYSFGLDIESLEKLAKRVNKPYLKSQSKSHLIWKLLQISAIRIHISVFGEFMCNYVPGLGTPFTTAVSFAATYLLLQNGLKVLTSAARTVLREAELQ